MKTMNVTAKHGQAAIHLGGHELSNGRWSPACGTQHHNAGGREVTPLRPTEQAVTCTRCLKVIERDAAKADTRKATKVRKAQPSELWQEERAGKSGMDSLREMLKLS